MVEGSGDYKSEGGRVCRGRGCRCLAASTRLKAGGAHAAACDIRMRAANRAQHVTALVQLSTITSFQGIYYQYGLELAFWNETTLRTPQIVSRLRCLSQNPPVRVCLRATRQLTGCVATAATQRFQLVNQSQSHVSCRRGRATPP